MKNINEQSGIILGPDSKCGSGGGGGMFWNGKDYVRKIEDEILTIKEAAEFLKIHTNTLYKLVKEKEVPHYKIGNHIRFKKNELLEMLKR